MSKRQVLMVLGIWIMVFLFISFPATWDKIFALITGLAIIMISFKLPPQVRTGSRDQIPYVESKKSASAPIESVPVVPSEPEEKPVIARKVSGMNDIIKADSRSDS